MLKGGSSGRTRGPSLPRWIGMAPALLFLLIFFVLPVVTFAGRSVLDPGFTLEHYIQILRQPVYFRILAVTFRIAACVTLLTLLFGYPFAYALYRAQGRLKWVLLGAILLPFWTSLLVRTFAFMTLLERQGVVNRLLLKLGLIEQPLALSHNLMGVLTGMSYMLLPFMVLPLYAVMERIDPLLEDVAMGLGASRFRAFLSTVVPLSIPGVLAGGALVFLLSLGFFVTPALLGGHREQMLSMVIETQVNDLLNWSFGAALSVMLLAFTAVSGAVFILLSWLLRALRFRIRRLS